MTDLTNLTKSQVKETEDLEAEYTSRKSFYGKAKVLTLANGIKLLKSYNTIVALAGHNPQTGKDVFAINGKYSATTSSHQREFLHQFAGKDIKPAQLTKYTADFPESTIESSAYQKGKIMMTEKFEGEEYDENPLDEKISEHAQESSSKNIDQMYTFDGYDEDGQHIRENEFGDVLADIYYKQDAKPFLRDLYNDSNLVEEYHSFDKMLDQLMYAGLNYHDDKEYDLYCDILNKLSDAYTDLKPDLNSYKIFKDMTIKGKEND